MEAGIHTIEHGNLIDADVAELMARRRTVLVPTLVTYQAMSEFGAAYGLPATNLAKNAVVYEAGLGSLKLAKDAGVTMGFGTDLIGETQPMQNQEMVIRSEVLGAEEILRSIWRTNAELCHRADEIGIIQPGAAGDLILSTVDPLDDIVAFADHERAYRGVVLGGRPVVDRSGIDR